MAINRKIVSVSVLRVSEDAAYVYEDALKAAIDAKLPPAENWSMVNIEKRDSAGTKDSYVIWAEQDA